MVGGFAGCGLGYNSAPTLVVSSMREPRAAPNLGAAFFRKWAHVGLACCCFLAVVLGPRGGPDERFWSPPAPSWGAPAGARLAQVRHASVVFVATGGRTRIPPFYGLEIWVTQNPKACARSPPVQRFPSPAPAGREPFLRPTQLLSDCSSLHSTYRASGSTQLLLHLPHPLPT